MKNTLMILLLSASLCACNQSKQNGADSTDSSRVQQPLPGDSVAKSAASTDTGKIKTVTADSLIIPGKGIGRILLNDDAAKAEQQLGKPDSSDAAMGSALLVWFAGHDPQGYRTSIFSHHNMGGMDEAIAHVKKVLVTSPGFKTTEGLGAGSTKADIEKSYTLKPTSTYNNKTGKVQVYTDMDKGISFEIEESSNKCVGVVVHKAQDTAAAYLSMH